MFKVVVLCSALAMARASYLTATHSVVPSAIISQSSGFPQPQGVFSQVSGYPRTFDGPYHNQRQYNGRYENVGDSYEHASSIVYDHAAAPGGQIRQDSSAGVYHPSSQSVSRVTYAADPAVYTASSASALAQTVSYAAPSQPLTAVSSYPQSYADHSVGTSRESEVRAHDGNRGVSHYTKAVDTAFSSVRKPDDRVTNEPKNAGTSPAGLTYTSATHASPLVSKATYVTRDNPGAIGYSSAPAVAHATFAGLGARYNW